MYTSVVTIVTWPEGKEIRMLENAFKAKFSLSDELQKVIIKHDFSKEDRGRDFQLRQEAKL